MTSIGVYVTSRYKNYPEFKATMDEALKKYVTVGKPNAIVTGSTKSNQSGNGLVRRYAFENGIPCRIFETEWSKHNPTKQGKTNDAGVRANAMIIKNSTGCIMFWTPTAITKWGFMSGGCYNFRKMCGKMERPLIPIQVDIYKPFDNTEVQPTMRNEPQQSIGGEFADIPQSQYSGTYTAPSTTYGSSSPSVAASPIGGLSMPSVTIQQPPSVQQNMFPTVGTPSGGAVDVDIDGDGTPDATVPMEQLSQSSGQIQNATVLPKNQSVGVDLNGDGTTDINVPPQNIHVNQSMQQQQSPQTQQPVAEQPQAQAVANQEEKQQTI